MSTTYFHPYHIVDQSPWPATGALGAFAITSGTIIWFHKLSPYLIIIGILILTITSYQWWRDIYREATTQGHHTLPVNTNIRFGIILFITSEVFFFVSFFWAYFHRSLSPTIEIGVIWPPIGISPFNPFQVPLLNTAILLSSGITVTWTHHRIINNNHSQTSIGLTITILLGFYFTLLQAYEYYEAPFTFADSIYGSTFFIATGFHGLHVIIGSIFLFICIMRHIKCHFSSTHHFGFEAAAWYWHFVDVVWLFLFVSIYWWGYYFSSIHSIGVFQTPGLIK